MTVRGIWLQKDAVTALRHAMSISPDKRGDRKHLRAICTLYHSRSATMFGSQSFSQPVPITGRTLDEGLLPLALQVYWHSRLWGPTVVMLVQLTLASKDDKDALVNEYCLGWARLHIVKVWALHFASEMKCRLRICMLIEGGLHACVDMSGPSDCF